MTKTVEFVFDVGSPYSYLAFHQLPKVAHAEGAEVIWTPVLVGAIFQATGARSPIEIPAKGRHAYIDLQRWARAYGVTIQMNPNFPINTLPLMRGAVAMQKRGSAEFHRYLGAIFSAMFEHPRNLGDPNEISKVLVKAGFDPIEFMALIGDQAVKDRLKDNTAHAIERGVFGVPTFFVGDEMFWGQDRMNFVAEALSTK